METSREHNKARWHRLCPWSLLHSTRPRGTRAKAKEGGRQPRTPFVRCAKSLVTWSEGMLGPRAKEEAKGKAEQTNQSFGPKGKCWKCGKAGHHSKDCRSGVRALETVNLEQPSGQAGQASSSF
eukprot:4922114-Amphidinium_carterae.1